MQLPVPLDVAQQVECRRFVGADGQAARRIAAQLAERIIEFLAKAAKSAGIFENSRAGVGYAEAAGGPVDEPLAEFFFQALDGERNRRLAARQLMRCAREALFRGNRPEHFELVD